MLKSHPYDFVLYGSVSSIDYQYAKFVLESNRLNADTKGLLESEFEKLKHEIKKTYSTVPFHHFTKDFLLFKGNSITCLDDLKIDADIVSTDLKRIASENLYKLLKDTNNPIVEIEMKIGNVIQDKIIIQVILLSYSKLFQDLTPKTVAKFLELVSGTKISTSRNIPLGYKNSKVARVLAGGWIQVGGMINQVNHRHM